MSKSFEKTLDFIGVSSATLCLIHCLVFPLITVIPIGFSHNHWVDLVFALIGLFAVIKILKTNTSIYIKFLLLISIVLIFSSIFITLFFHHHSVLLYIGGVGMIVGHLLNFKTHRHS
ncbi:MerC domain-containing protein [Flavobacterium sp.]|jgi:hypothetical protein|uniref:MerC domain-containing protein n=1 Tax=Flavobacterium sp. TaxID=239 RepID=UPI000ED0CC1C|nr:MerC domain-containing protein [Flavobacterium sp.]HCQ14243.1 MerC mercury resistance protein [Flavobacterium sp.]